MTEEIRVLVVDDEPRNVKLIGAIVGGAGWRSIEAGDGAQALELARTTAPHVILLDVMMPGLDGFEVTRRLKADPLTRHIPVVLVTSLDGKDNRVKGLDAGADEFLTKPVNRVELMARVRALHRMNQMQAELLTRAQITQKILASGADNPTAGMSILLIEDEHSQALQLATLLREEGMDVILADTATAARTRLAQFVPDLIILDILLPDMNGLDLLDSLKKDERLQDIPVLVTTGLSDLDNKVRGLELGADDYLVKPIDDSELLARIRAAYRRSRAQRQLRQNVDRLLADNVTDRLTGVRNRHYLDADLEYRFALAKRQTERGFAVAMADIDHFKSVNDRFGHLAGDAVLRKVAKFLQEEARSADIVARYGGEEFCLIFPETDAAGARLVAERMRAAIAAQRFDGLGGQPVTVSFGLATCSAVDRTFKDLLKRADEALYQAKGGGRNRVCTAD